MSKRTRPKRLKAHVELDDEAVAWVRRIEDAHQKAVGLARKTAAAAIKTGRVLIEARAAVEPGQWGSLLRALSFGEDLADRLRTIAANPLLSDPANLRKLPAAVDTLLELDRLPEAVLKDALKAGTVHAKMKKHDAARLGGREPEPAWWSHTELMRQIRRLAERALSRIAKDDLPHFFERPGEGFTSPAEYAVGHSLRAVAHELLTPLPDDEREKLNDEFDEWERMGVEADVYARTPLSNRKALCQWVLDHGGMRPTKEYEDLPPRILNAQGPSYDELADLLAEETGLRFRDVERRMMRLLAKWSPPQPRGKRQASPAAVIKAITRVKNILDGRALKTGHVPLYYIGAPLPPEWAAEMDRQVQAVKDRHAQAIARGEVPEDNVVE